jgi:serine O-acetyltransferase
MRVSLSELILALSCVRLVPHISLMLLSSNRDLIWADLDRWGQVRYWPPRNLLSRIHLFAFLMTFRPEYRTTFYLRTGRFGMLLSVFCRQIQTLSLEANSIGAGLYIEHGYGTLVSAESIGENCWINQLVTVGHTDTPDRPTIGNNVSIRAGATIVGKVQIGDNSTIGANSLVITDVPPGVTVMGVPARIIWRRDSMPRTTGTPADPSRDASDIEQASYEMALAPRRQPSPLKVMLPPRSAPPARDAAARRGAPP